MLVLPVCNRTNWIITEDNDIVLLNPYRGFIFVKDLLEIGSIVLPMRSAITETVSRSGDLVMALVGSIAVTKDDFPASVEGLESHNTKCPIPIRISIRIHRRGAEGLDQRIGIVVGGMSLHLLELSVTGAHLGRRSQALSSTSHVNSRPP